MKRWRRQGRHSTQVQNKTCSCEQVTIKQKQGKKLNGGWKEQHHPSVVLGSGAPRAGMARQLTGCLDRSCERETGATGCVGGSKGG